MPGGRHPRSLLAAKRRRHPCSLAATGSRRGLRAAVALSAGVAAASLGSGCGQVTHVGAARTLSVTLTEYRIRPARSEVGSGSVTIIVRNAGLLTHNLVVSESGHTIGSTKPIPPGQTST